MQMKYSITYKAAAVIEMIKALNQSKNSRSISHWFYHAYKIAFQYQSYIELSLIDLAQPSTN